MAAAPAPAAKKKEVAKKGPKSVTKKSAYKINGNKIERTKPMCPKCGPGIFMATHKDRVSCGKCGYTEFKKEKA
ncbi:MAG: 30S ribosomal protein S27ae [Candidatus Methanoplasma sp.]|jgi:small subunit ribosomal protein S27Ae|nr:30S ribosomal protein S27ae [Candidatus Methanoplasma sp.]